MELLVCMSIAGSIPVVICLFLYVIQRENYNYILGRRLLITGIFFYLIPIQLIKYLIPEEVYPEALFNEEAQLYLSNSLSFWTERKGEYIWVPQWFDIISKFWLSGIVIFAVYEIIKYWRGAHYIKNFIFEKEEDPENNLTYYLIPDDTYGPCTIGFFRQKIVIPESFPLHPDFVMVYKHEGAHLKNHDNLVKLLCLLVLCVHWMNPVAYLLLLLYIDTAEIVSDSAAVEGCSKEKRKDYAKLLVLEASTSDIRPVVWKNNLSGHKKDKEGKDFKTIKRRINYMMKEKRKGLLQRGIMVAVSVLTIVAGAGTVLAYEAVPSSDESFCDVILEDSLDDFGDDCIDTSITDSLDFSKSDIIFIDSDGEQTTDDALSSSSSYALCTHIMADSAFYTHAKNADSYVLVYLFCCDLSTEERVLCEAAVFGTQGGTFCRNRPQSLTKAVFFCILISNGAGTIFLLCQLPACMEKTLKENDTYEKHRDRPRHRLAGPHRPAQGAAHHPASGRGHQAGDLCGWRRHRAQEAPPRRQLRLLRRRGHQRHPVCRVLHLPRLPPQDRRAINQNQKEACVHEPHDRFYCPFHRARAHPARVLL